MSVPLMVVPVLAHAMRSCRPAFDPDHTIVTRWIAGQGIRLTFPRDPGMRRYQAIWSRLCKETLQTTGVRMALLATESTDVMEMLIFTHIGADVYGSVRESVEQAIPDIFWYYGGVKTVVVREDEPQA